MEDLIVNCRTGKTTRKQVAPEEAAQRQVAARKMQAVFDDQLQAEKAQRDAAAQLRGQLELVSNPDMQQVLSSIATILNCPTCDELPAECTEV